MDIYDSLYKIEEWESFYNLMLENEHASAHDKKELRKYIDEKRYLSVLKDIEEKGELPVPKLMLVNKKASQKKRKVFCFDEDFSWILKLISIKLQEYDYLFSDNLYSFRKRRSARTAIADLVKIRGIEEMYAYKLDIHDYFNSVDSRSALELARAVLDGNDKLYSLLEAMLLEPYAMDGEKKIEITKGIMAGTSIAPFFANLYLRDIDEYFAREKVIYFRYSDDIIIFDRDEERLKRNKDILIDQLEKKGLELNPKKICSYQPHDEWEYLGISYRDGDIDISKVSFEKMKGKLRRKAHSIYRWKIKKNIESERAIRSYIKHFNIKFYNNPKKNELTWCRWYFPLINTTGRLKMLDRYMVECIRYIVTGRHTKSNYNLRYDTIKSYGYRPLVSEYYKKEKDMKHISREEAVELLKKYNKDPFHLQHAYTVEEVMKWYANELGYAEDVEFWGIVGLLHDIDFELYPEEHCLRAPELLRDGGVGEDIIHAVCSHGYGITVECGVTIDVEPVHEMEKVLFAADELTGLIWAAALMRPSKSTKDMELKSLKKKYKSKGFAAGCSREVIERGAEQLGWELDKLLTMTLDAMRATEDIINAKL